jgi:transposase
VVELLKLTRGQLEFFAAIQRRLLKGLCEHPDLSERVIRLQTIPGVGEIMALSWALEVGEVDRLASIAQAASYCGLTSAQHNSGGKEQRGPISKQRNAKPLPGIDFLCRCRYSAHSTWDGGTYPSTTVKQAG